MEHASKATVLYVQEAVPLLHAVVASVCERGGIRALFLKGPGAVDSGLRPPRASCDVDVLVSPENVEALRAKMKLRGWLQRPRDWADDVFPEHSYTLYHPGWPCDIDIHYHFPGFEADRKFVFETLWTERTTTIVADREIYIPGRVGGTLVLALHALRTPLSQRNNDELAFLATSTERAEVTELLIMASATGSLGALKPFVEMAYGRISGLSFPSPSREWLIRSMAQTSAAIRLVALVDAPWSRKGGLLRRALWPSDSALAAVDLTMGNRGRTQVWMRRSGRIVRFAKDIPRTIAAYRAFRQADATSCSVQKTVNDR